MRGLFIALLLANLGFAAWLALQDQPAESNSARSIKSGVPAIVLLREVALSEETVAEPETSEKTQPPATAEVEPEKKASISADDLKPAEPAQVTATESCYTLGPFREMDKLREVIRAIKDNVLEASFRSSEERKQALFWVYLKPESDLQSAKNTTRMLRKKKIRDSYIIADGKNKLGISLGHFKEKTRAYALRDKVDKLGFEPRVDPVFRNYTIYWLDYKMPARSESQAVLNGISLDKNVSRFDRPCG